MKVDVQEIEVNGVQYVAKESVQHKAASLDGMKYVLVRGDRSGVFMGYLKEGNGQEVILLKVRRIWYWSGAASISQLATDGASNPSDCKIPCEVTEIKIKDAIEILDVTEKARLSIEGVSVWQS